MSLAEGAWGSESMRALGMRVGPPREHNKHQQIMHTFCSNLCAHVVAIY